MSDCNDAFRSRGKPGFHRSIVEEGSRKYRRSLYFMRDLKAGDVVTSSDIRAIRPGYGISPKFFDQIINKVLNKDVERGDPVLLNVFLE